MSKLLITGGAGFIGSHTCILLLKAGHDLVVLDSFVNSSAQALKAVCQISGIENNEELKRIQIFEGDVRDTKLIENIFFTSKKEDKSIDAVLHFAGLKSVRISTEEPLLYWDVNLNGSCNLLSIMETYSCRTIVFSSSATVYGRNADIPIKESAEINPINPYGQTKAAVEKMLNDLFNMNKNWRIACLRYFNPVGAHQSGLIGEDPLDTPNNLFPIINQVAINKLPYLKVYGNDWPTDDGSGIRDYIHVMDLAEGHIMALDYLLKNSPQIITLNLGSGKGYSVFEVLKSFEVIYKTKIPYKIVDRRVGDSAISIADTRKANSILGWKAKISLLDCCQDSWNWQTLNAKGYK